MDRRAERRRHADAAVAVEPYRSVPEAFGDESTNTGTLVGADARHTGRISARGVPLTVRPAGGSGGLLDPESLHQRLERRTLHADPPPPTPRPSPHPVPRPAAAPEVGPPD